MFSAWMIGMEDEPERCGEICLVEVFGDEVSAESAPIGRGIKAYRDPTLIQEFSAEHRTIDISRTHRYGIDWRPDGVDFFLDGELNRSSTQSPDYPMLLILVFDFPARATSGVQPELVVSLVRGQ